MKIKYFTFNPFQENTFIVYNEKEAIIIDPGCSTQEEENMLADFINSNNLKVKYLLNTHGHLDHICGNGFVENTFGVKAQIHKDDLFLIEGIEEQIAEYKFPDIKYKASIPEKFLSEGDIISFGEDSFEVIHVPGHSPGGIVLYCKEKKFMFSGDSVFYGSIGRADLPGGNQSLLISSIKRKILTLPPDTDIICGHGPSTSVAFEKKHNPFL